MPKKSSNKAKSQRSREQALLQKVHLNAAGIDIGADTHWVAVPDVKDCQWLQQLHTFGMLGSSFRPQAQMCVVRSYLRLRDTLSKDCNSLIQRMQKALTEMNVQLHRVISDITGGDWNEYFAGNPCWRTGLPEAGSAEAPPNQK